MLPDDRRLDSERPLPPPSEQTLRMLGVFRELREIDLDHLRTVLLPQLEGLVDAERENAYETRDDPEVSNQYAANANEAIAVLQRVEMYLRNVEPGLRDQADAVRDAVRAAADRLGIILIETGS